MSEADVVEKTIGQPATLESLAADLVALGLKPGMTVLVHSSLKSLGWVSGGTVAVILALEQVLSPTGTLVLPTHSGNLSDPANWENPPVPRNWWKTIRQTMPAYDPDLTPTAGMGAIPECFRKQRGVTRTIHPHFSFAAWGAGAESVIGRHPLNFALGETSPLARIYDLDGWVLLLGVGHDSNTSLHLAEYRASYPSRQVISCGTPLLVNGERRWYEYRDIKLDSSDFDAIGAAYTESGGLTYQASVACAPSLLIPQRPLVDFAVKWMENHRK